MPENEIFLQTPNERMSDLATDYAYLRNLQLTKPMTQDEYERTQKRMDDIEAEKSRLKEQYK